VADNLSQYIRIEDEHFTLLCALFAGKRISSTTGICSQEAENPISTLTCNPEHHQTNQATKTMPQQPTFECGVCLLDKSNPITVASGQICRDCFIETLVPQFLASVEPSGEFPVRWGATELKPKDYTPFMQLPPGFWKKWNERNHEHKKTATVTTMLEEFRSQGLARGKDYQCCPSKKCGIPIQLKDGCNAMLCKRCYTEFCFICGEMVKHDDKEHWRKPNPCPRWNRPGEANAWYDQEAANERVARLLQHEQQFAGHVADRVREHQISEEEKRLAVAWSFLTPAVLVALFAMVLKPKIGRIAWDVVALLHVLCCSRDLDFFVWQWATWRRRQGMALREEERRRQEEEEQQARALVWALVVLVLLIWLCLILYLMEQWPAWPNMVVWSVFVFQAVVRSQHQNEARNRRLRRFGRRQAA
jgi:hypothetical protein